MPEIERYGDGFDDFRDHPGSAFYTAAGLTPEETNREIVRSMDHVLHTVIERHQAGQTIPLSTDALCHWHRGIFVSTFPDDAGRLRWKTGTGAWEMVSFGISIGTRMTRRILPRQGARPRVIQRRLDRIFDRYADEHARASTDGTTLHDAALSATHVYAKTLSVHAFVDGNLRASFVALQAALLNYGLLPWNVVSTVTIIDLDTPGRVEHVVFGDELVALSDAAIHALSINAQILAIGDTARADHTDTAPAAAASAGAGPHSSR